jgi:hypothetical protein
MLKRKPQGSLHQLASPGDAPAGHARNRVATAAVTLARVAALSNTSKVLARGKGRRGWGGADAPVAGAGNPVAAAALAGIQITVFSNTSEAGTGRRPLLDTLVALAVELISAADA